MSDTPWIGRLAVELKLCTDDDLATALQRQGAEPAAPLGTLLGLSEAERERIRSHQESLKSDLLREAEDQAFEAWAVAGGQVRQEALNQARSRAASGEGRLFEALLIEEDLELDSTPRLGAEPWRCHACPFEFRLANPLLPFVTRCPSCGAASQVEGAASTVDEDLPTQASAYGGLSDDTPVRATSPGGSSDDTPVRANSAPGGLGGDDPTRVNSAPGQPSDDAPTRATSVHDGFSDGGPTRPAQVRQREPNPDDAPTRAGPLPAEAEQLEALNTSAMLEWAIGEERSSREAIEALAASARAEEMSAGEKLVISGLVGLEELMGFATERHQKVECTGDCRSLFVVNGALAGYALGLPCPGCGGVLELGGGRSHEPEDTPRNAGVAEPATGQWSGPLDAHEAQAALSDAAFARWAQDVGQVDPADVEAALASKGELHLAEALIQQCPDVDMFAAMETLEDEHELSCPGCKSKFRIGRQLLDYARKEDCPQCRTPLAEGEGSADDGRVGPYTLDGLLARGGMGEIHLARDEAGNPLALKLLSYGMADAAARRRFVREGRVLEDIIHPNVVRLLASGFDKTTPFLALEFIHGGNLKQILDRTDDGKFPPGVAAMIIRDCARGLMATHDHGVIHRDLKPANVMVTVDGQVKLTDFGIALTEDVSVRLTAQDEVMGTPHYLPPETLSRQDWVPASDVHALGVLAYRLLAGKVPFGGLGVIAVFESIQLEIPVPIVELDSEVPQEISEIVGRMLAKSPGERPSLAEVTDVLGAFVPTDPGALTELRTLAGQCAGEAGVILPESMKTLSLGRTYGSYRLDAELGRGGMGIVYRAFHEGLKKTVALKVMLTGSLASEEERRRFMREAEAAGALEHPAIVRVQDVGEHDGSYFISMEYVEGKTLAPDPERPRELLRLFAEVCDGVHHAHTRGIIHRDLKPDNVIVDAEYHPHILDFGIAKKIDQQEDPNAPALTTQGDVIGTLRYMPPEQASGEIDKVDVRSDVYALGSILYELVSGGETPFRGSTRELLHQIIFTDPRPPSLNSKQIEVPWELDAICLKALEKDRDDRYQSALELRKDLERYLKDEPIRARRTTPIYRMRKWARRNRRKAAAIATVVLVILGLITAFVDQATDNERQRVRSVRVAGEQGLTYLSERKFGEATAKFSEAYNQSNVHDVLPLSAAVVELMPEELLARIPEDQRASPRITQDRLRDWGAFATKRLEFEQVNRSLKLAEEAMTVDDLEGASEAILGALALTPDDPAVRQLNAEITRAFMGLGQAALQSARKLPAEEFEARERDLDRANSAFMTARHLDSEGASAVEGLQSVKLAQHELGQDRARVQKVKLAKTRLFQARATKAAALEAVQAGQLDVAREQLERGRLLLVEALVSSPKLVGAKEESVRLALLLGEIALQQDNLGRAEQELESARFYESLPEEVAAFAARLKNTDRSARAFRAHLEEGEALYAKNELVAAQRKFDQALALRPENPDAARRRDLCRALVSAQEAAKRGDALAERQALLQAQELHEDPHALATRLGALDEQLYEDAVRRAGQAYAQAAQLGTGWPAVQALYERALTFSSRGADALRGRADAYAESKRPEAMVLVSIPQRLLATGATANRISASQALRFYVSRDEVTNGEFAQFVAAGAYSNQELWSPDAWQLRDRFVDTTGKPGPATWVDGAPPAGSATLPVSGVSYHEAWAYSNWSESRLLSEDEWLLACCFDPRTTRRFRYPWGDELPTDRQRTALRRVRPVGGFLRDTSPWGVRDMGFNVAEWVQLRSGDPVVRGLSFQVFEHDLRLGPLESRKRPRAAYRDAVVGFRCAQDVPKPPVLPLLGERRK